MIAPDQILTAEQMRAAEQALFDAGETSESLMERAGLGAAEWVRRMAAGRDVTVLCGPGNNGGDGYVIARHLAQWGHSVNLVAPIPPQTDAAKAAASHFTGRGMESDYGLPGHVLVDCLFGTGLSRPLEDAHADLLGSLAGHHPLRISVDLPSGVESDTGGTFGRDLPAYDLTIALGAWKRAHWLMPASARMGTRKLVDIGVDKVEAAAQLATRPKLHAPAADAHKYTRGMAVVVGGEMPGAAIMAARAAQHGGAGYVKFASEHSHPAMPLDVVHDEAELGDILDDDRIGAVLVGPGLGRREAARHRLRAALSGKWPLVLDADALTLLTPEYLVRRGEGILCTPHEGELASMCSAFGINAETKLDRARALHDATGMTILAKGADTLLAGASGITMFPPSSSWLSTAGTGDVLAGLCVSRMAMGEDAESAARVAVALHSRAAHLSPPTFTAAQLIDALPLAYGQFS